MVGEEIEERVVVIGVSDNFQAEVIDGLNEGEVVVIERAVKEESSGMGFFGQ